MEIQSIKQRFGIIGNSSKLNQALETAIKVAPTDMNVLILGESGVGKESFSKIIHQISARKHGNFIAVNCGAIPEGTIDSELFGHEKGAFTGATDKRKGYFETVNGGTIFLDEVGELPLGTQARLLRILENGEFIKVGSSAVQKTDVRVVAATNRDLLERAAQGKFREDLYYRLATVPIRVPSLKERKEDISLLFKKFVSDFTESHHSKAVSLTEEAQIILEQYPWPGNVRQLKNIAEQICVLEDGREISAEDIRKYLPKVETHLPVLLGRNEESYAGMSERDVFYKVLVDLKKDVNDLKKVVFGLLEGGNGVTETAASKVTSVGVPAIPSKPMREESSYVEPRVIIHTQDHEDDEQEYIVAETTSGEADDLSLEAKEIEMIKKALDKNKGKRKKAAQDLGISERTLYRKIKQYELD